MTAFLAVLGAEAIAVAGGALALVAVVTTVFGRHS